MTKPIFIVVVGNVSDQQRNQIHEILKVNSDDWWHQVPDAWLVRGKSAVEWRGLISPIVPNAPSAVFVFKIDTRAGWAAFAQQEASLWLDSVWGNSP